MRLSRVHVAGETKMLGCQLIDAQHLRLSLVAETGLEPVTFGL